MSTNKNYQHLLQAKHLPSILLASNFAIFLPSQSSFFQIWALPKSVLGNALSCPPSFSMGSLKCPAVCGGREEAHPPARPGSGVCVLRAAVSPPPGLSLSARPTASPPGGRGCHWTSRMKTGMPRKGNWSCLFPPGIKTLIRKRRKVEAPPGSAIPRRGEREKARAQEARPASWWKPFPGGRVNLLGVCCLYMIFPHGPFPDSSWTSRLVNGKTCQLSEYHYIPRRSNLDSRLAQWK